MTENIWATDPNVKRIVKIIDEQRTKFNGYQSKNDLVMLFKMQMNIQIVDVKYNDYLKAFRVSKINKEFIPANEDELKKWDIEYMELCKVAVTHLKTRIDSKPFSLSDYNFNAGRLELKTNRMNSSANTNMSNALVTKEERQFSKYKTESDATNYIGWEMNATLSTYGKLLDAFQKELEAIEKRINFNK